MKEEAKYMCLRWLATHIALRKRAVRDAARFSVNREALAGQQKEITLALELPVRTQTVSATKAVGLV
jgi:hypothetical protein